MSNKTFAIIIILILVVFALIYIPSSQTSEYQKQITTQTTTSTAKEKETKESVDFDDVVDSKKKISVSDSEKAEKRTIKINVDAPKVTTNKKKITVHFSDNTKTTTPSKKITISTDNFEQEQNTTIQNPICIRVIWENINGNEKGAYTVQTELDTILSEELITENIVKKGYNLKEIAEGGEYLNTAATKNEYTIKIKVYN